MAAAPAAHGRVGAPRGVSYISCWAGFCTNSAPMRAAPPPPRRLPLPLLQLLLLLFLGAATPSLAKLLLTPSPPLGFNTFDSYGDLNHSETVALADALASQLGPHGYEYLVL